MIFRPVPKKGWIKEMRTILLMSSKKLAERVGVAPSGISLFEKREREKTITLESLAKIAEALECDLYYELTPKNGL